MHWLYVSRLLQPITPERRESIRIIVAVRWLLVASSLVVVNVRPGTTAAEQATLTALIILGAAINLVLQFGVARRLAFPLGLPVLAAVADVAAITAAVRVVDGFTNPGYLLYYPALVSFSLAFSGTASIIYTVSVAWAYVMATTTRDGFDWASAGDQHELILRLTTMAGAVLAANMVVRIERDRRNRAVAAEAARQREVIELEQRTRDLERQAEDERARLIREIHDGLSQEAYMLSLGLETTVAELAKFDLPAATTGRLDALARVSRQTLLDTRNLLYDVRGTMTGQAQLSGLLANQVAEFRAITGIDASIQVSGEERPLNPAAVSELYRVVQEGLSNAFRHAAASTVRLELVYGEEGVTLVLTDDGSGFERGSERGNGLRTMRERVENEGGSFAVDSRPGDGTRLTLRIPYNASDGTNSRSPR